MSHAEIEAQVLDMIAEESFRAGPLKAVRLLAECRLLERRPDQRHRLLDIPEHQVSRRQAEKPSPPRDGAFSFAARACGAHF
jgi:hypothetical protein